MSGYHWLASYPKSGNTWLRLALASVRADGRAPGFAAADRFGPVASDRAAFDLLLDVDSADLTDGEAEILRPRLYELEAGSRPEPQLLKVHDAWTRTPAGEPLFPPALTRGAIYLARDPRDVAVSLAHHMAIGLDQAIDFMGWPDAALALHGLSRARQIRQRLLTWSGHVRSWRQAPRLLPLRYEDMLSDPGAVLEAAARHLGWAVSQPAIAEAVAATRFEALRAAEERWGFAEKARPATRFFRRGVAGGWRDTLSRAQAARIEADHGEVMRELRYL